MTQIQGLTTETLATENRAAEGMMNERLQDDLAGNVTDNVTGSLDAALAPTLATEEPTPAVATATPGVNPRPLSAHIKTMLEDYFRELDGHPPADLYQMVLAEVEQPLLESVLHYTRGNQSKAAAMLGLNRGTLRKKLKQYDIN